MPWISTRGARTTQIDVLDAANGGFLDSRSVSGFAQGQYVVWTMTGHVVFRLTRTSGVNAIVSGLFIE